MMNLCDNCTYKKHMSSADAMNPYNISICSKFNTILSKDTTIKECAQFDIQSDIVNMQVTVNRHQLIKLILDMRITKDIYLAHNYFMEILLMSFDNYERRAWSRSKLLSLDNRQLLRIYNTCILNSNNKTA
jgi:hypothetical protein